MTVHVYPSLTPGESLEKQMLLRVLHDQQLENRMHASVVWATLWKISCPLPASSLCHHSFLGNLPVSSQSLLNSLPLQIAQIHICLFSETKAIEINRFPWIFVSFQLRLKFFHLLLTPPYSLGLGCIHTLSPSFCQCCHWAVTSPVFKLFHAYACCWGDGSRCEQQKEAFLPKFLLKS